MLRRGRAGRVKLSIKECRKRNVFCISVRGGHAFSLDIIVPLDFRLAAYGSLRFSSHQDLRVVVECSIPGMESFFRFFDCSSAGSLGKRTLASEFRWLGGKATSALLSPLKPALAWTSTLARSEVLTSKGPPFVSGSGRSFG